MRYSFVAAALATSSVATAQTFRIVANVDNSQTNTWYGDGNLYIGNVPDTVQNAVNFTIPNYTATLPKVVVGPVAPYTQDDLPKGTFLAVNNKPGATDPVLLAAPGTKLPKGHVEEWLRYGLLLIPRGTVASTTPPYYLEEAGEGTWRVTWRAEGAGSGGLKRVGLEAVL